MVHGEAFDVVFLQINPLIRIDISNGDKDQVVIGDSVDEPLESGDGLGQSSGMRDRISVVVAILVELRLYEVWMSINPYDFEVFVVSVECMQSGSAYGVISSNCHHHSFFIFIQPIHYLAVELAQQVI